MTERENESLADILERVVVAIVDDRIADAERLLSHIDKVALLAERDERRASVRESKRKARLNGLVCPETMVDLLTRPDDRKARDVDVYTRDSYTCRYCGERTIAILVLDALIGVVRAPGLLPSPPKSGGWTPVEEHILYWTATPANDHRFPKSRGGTCAARNRMTACARCNDAKKEYTPEELGWACVEPSGSSWRGLTEHLEALRERQRSLELLRTPTTARAHLGAIAALETDAIEASAASAALLRPGVFIVVKRPGQSVRYKNVVVAVDGDTVELKRLWVANGVWVAERHAWHGRIEELTSIEIISNKAPTPGERSS